MKIFPIFLSGFKCPHNCIYCNPSGTSGFKDIIPIDVILNNVRSSLDSLNIEYQKKMEVAIYGTDLPSIQCDYVKKLMSELRKMVENQSIAGIRLSVRPDTLLFMDSLDGISTIELGVPSMNDDVLKYISRGHRSNTVLKAVDYLRKMGITFGFQTMIGLPGGGAREAVESAKKLCALSPNFVRIHPTLVLANTELCKRFESKEYQPLTLDKAVKICAKLVEIYKQKDIRVARVGFYIPDELIRHVLVKGPHHRSFGYLVKSEIHYREMREYFKQNPTSSIYRVPNQFLSEYVGFKKRNIRRLRREFGEKIVLKNQ